MSLLRKFFNLNALGGTVLVFFFMWGFGSLGIQVEFLNVFEEVFEDFDLTHLYYSKIRDPQTVPYEDKIVLVNIGKVGRREIAEQINILNKYKAKVIGIDARFYPIPESDPSYDPVGDFLLMQAFKNTENIIIGSELQNPNVETQTWDTLKLPQESFLPYVTPAYVNIGNTEDSEFPFWGTIPPKYKLKNGDEAICFAAEVMRLYDPSIAEEFLSRGHEKEVIYFKGNFDKYTKLEVDQVLQEDFAPELIEGKIVLMGYMGSGYNDYFFDEDKFYTPLNDNLLGRSFPDMFGVVVHANILSMMFDRTYINEMPKILSVIVAVLLCYFNMLIFSQIIYNPKLSVWYNGISKLIQLIEAIVVYAINLYIFDAFNYQADLTLSLFVIILSGDLCEIYVDVLLNLFKRLLLKLNI